MLHGNETATSCIHLNYSKVCVEAKTHCWRRFVWPVQEAQSWIITYQRLEFLNRPLGSFRGSPLNKEYLCNGEISFTVISMERHENEFLIASSSSSLTIKLEKCLFSELYSRKKQDGMLACRYTMQLLMC